MGFVRAARKERYHRGLREFQVDGLTLPLGMWRQSSTPSIHLPSPRGAARQGELHGVAVTCPGTAGNMT